MVRHHAGRVIAAATTLCAAALAANPATAETSSWETNFGQLHLTMNTGDRVTGVYPDFQGRFMGELDRETGAIGGYWLQPRSETRCSTEMMGTPFWGRVVWWLLPGGVLTGQWSYCDAPVGTGGGWNGGLQAGVHPLDVATLEEGPLPPDEHLPPRAMEPARFLWGPEVDPARLEAREADVTCDGRPDVVLQYLDLDAPDGPFLTIAVHQPGRNLEEISVVWLEFDSAAYTALCGQPRLVSMDIMQIEPESVLDLTGYTSPPVCIQGIALDDTMCDRVWLFTTPGDHGLRDFVIGRH